MNREQLRQEKQKECDARIAQLYDYIPRLEELDFAIGQKNVAMIRSGILHKNKIQQDALQMEIEALMKDRHQLLEQYGPERRQWWPRRQSLPAGSADIPDIKAAASADCGKF